MKARIRTIMMVPLAGAVLVACGSEDSPPHSESTEVAIVEPTTPAVATPPATVIVGDVIWATGLAEDTGAPVDELAALPNNAERVVAAVEASDLPEGTILQAQWSIDGEPLTALEPEPLIIDAARTDAWVAWTLTWTSEQPWPVGQLGIAIEVNGESVASDEIPIVRSRE